MLKTRKVLKANHALCPWGISFSSPSLHDQPPLITFLPSVSNESGFTLTQLRPSSTIVLCLPYFTKQHLLQFYLDFPSFSFSFFFSCLFGGLWCGDFLTVPCPLARWVLPGAGVRLSRYSPLRRRYWTGFLRPSPARLTLLFLVLIVTRKLIVSRLNATLAMNRCKISQKASFCLAGCPYKVSG